MRKAEDHKEYYELWVEYLKESKRYERFCENRAERERDAKVNIYEALLKKQPANERRKLQKRRDSYERWKRIFKKFGDIYSSDYDLEVWWSRTLKLMQKDKDSLAMGKLDVKAVAKELIDYMTQLNDEQGIEEFDLEHIYDGLDERCGEFAGQIVLWVDTYFPLPDLVEKLEEIIGQHKRDHEITPEEEERAMNYRKPVIKSNHLTPEIGKYLQVYRMKKTMDWVTVVKAMAPSTSNSGVYRDTKGKEHVFPNTLRSFQRFKKKAENIIRNVEKDDFPGDYGEE